MFIQKGKIRFSQQEVWNLDTHLAKIIYTGLVQFKQSKRHGVPALFAEVTSEYPLGNATEVAIQSWEETLDQMIYAFSLQQDYDEIESSIYDLKMIEDVERQSNSDDSIPIKILTLPKMGVTEQDIEDYKERKQQWEQADMLKR